ncbi:MAG: transglycosylase SLT domain-containing protein [Rhizobacter sp.]|nr:transglycosylase SLT domain-containing protein [Bacteriovorax sp.]
MKTKNKDFQATSLLLLLSLFNQSCSTTKTQTSENEASKPVTITEDVKPLMSLIFDSPGIPYRGYNKFSIDSKVSLPPRFENFDKKPFPADAFVIANMIAVVQPEMDEEQRDLVASKMAVAIKKYNIEPQIFVAIIDTESNFNPDLVSSTGDLSLAQINVDMWNKEFARMRHTLIDKERVKVDQVYALSTMAEILNIIKLRYEKIDQKWYARYHSSTEKYKSDYLRKLDMRLSIMATSDDLANQVAQIKNLKLLAPNIFADKKTKHIQAQNFVAAILNLKPMSSPIPQYTMKSDENLKLSEFASDVDQDVLRL